ncbi:DMT family transporter [Pigmentiphaga litoralis]|uniref:Drug/metabolite transporter (DMT)-like permease n=1 Tax=Pigmentiphaga litoralis TaxID=516702 RepID=A0A7Y9IVX3_9BURK|nr:DMT family transporter [Pigmentiphaga litoralis]NYE22436.1 drug/metabolite transporter (DMT)-like permease [Pigmentiphaga litoralis]NYE83949.1 drug/metabolite transporter (DMT)-like permease [Pigmentiphaga litoralis]
MTAAHLLAPLLAVMIWAVNTIVSKLAAGVIDPAAISLFRWVLAGGLLGLVFGRSVWRARALVVRLLPKLFVLSMLGMVLYQCLAYVAASTTTATNMGIVISLMPLLAVVLSVLILREVITVGAVLGGLLSIAGLAYLLSHGDPASLLTAGVRLGDGLMLLASLAYAGYAVLLKKWKLPLGNWQSLTVQTWCAVPVLFVYYLINGAPPITQAGLPLVLYAGIPASVLAPFLWMLGIARLGPMRTTALMNLLPVFTVAIAMAFLGETLHAYDVIGGVVTLLGVGVAQAIKTPLLRRDRER